MKNIIVVTGGAGFIGSNLIKYLITKTKYKIISIDNYSTGKKSNHIKTKRVKYFNCENKDISKALKKYKNKILTVFHFGEFSRIYMSFKFIDQCYNSNMLGTFNVVKFCSENNVRIIYSASSSKFGNDGKDEHLSPYSWSKSKNIEFIKNFSKWYNLKYEILYFYNVYGNNHIKNNKMAAVIGIFESQFIKRKALTVVRPGTQRRDFTHVNDIIRGCYLAFKKGKNTEYMLGTKKTYSVIQVAKMFKTKIKFIPSRPGERLGSINKNNKALSHLGYKAKIDIKKYIEAFIKR